MGEADAVYCGEFLRAGGTFLRRKRTTAEEGQHSAPTLAMGEASGAWAPPVCPLDAQMQEVDEWSAPGIGGSLFPLLSPYSPGRKRERTRPGAMLRGWLGRQGPGRATAQTPDARFSSPPRARDSLGRPLLRCLLWLGPGDSGMERAQGLRLGSQDHFAPYLLSLGALPVGAFTHKTPREFLPRTVIPGLGLGLLRLRN